MLVVLMSGGVDSTVLAERAHRAGRLSGCVFVDYGHPAQVAEAWRVFAWCGARAVPLKVIHVFGLDLGDMESERGARVVEARNAILLSVAANAARKMGATELQIGAILDDDRDYHDCRPPFLAAMQYALAVTVTAPLIRTSKADVMREAEQLGVLAGTWSCYTAGPNPCGTCPSCRARSGA